MKILVLCTGNSCRSQMAEAFLKSFDGNLEVYSAGTAPAIKVHPKAIQVMKEVGIDISANKTKTVQQFLSQSFDYVITVCDNAKETCPFFTGKVEHRLHMGFEDPAEAIGTEEEILSVFRKVRDQIRKEFKGFLMSIEN
ncbi:MAG: arsenate reductase ArsC [Bacteroidetes bacterium]|nr:arsenate reductase ArsC [Bacteroidota bacterium]